VLDGKGHVPSLRQGGTCPFPSARAGHAGSQRVDMPPPARSHWTYRHLVRALHPGMDMSRGRARSGMSRPGGWTCAVDGPGRACQAPGNGHVLSCAPRRACRSLTSPHALPLPQPSDISPSCPRPPARNGHVRRTGQAGHVRHPKNGHVLPCIGASPPQPAAIGYGPGMPTGRGEEWTCPADGPGRACQAPGNGHVLPCFGTGPPQPAATGHMPDMPTDRGEEWTCPVDGG
jgi:hypothetical protein